MSFENLEFGKYLRMLREQKGLSQDKLSLETYISKSTIYRLENGYNTPTIEILDILSKFYKIDLINFIIESGSNEFKVLELISYNIDNFLYKFDFESFQSELLKINKLHKSSNLELNNIINQKIFFYKGIYHLRQKNYDLAYNLLLKSILVNNPHFDITNYKDYLYPDHLHFRTLMSLAIFMYYLGFNNEYKNILLDLLNNYPKDDNFKTDIIHNVSILYQRINDIEKSYMFLNLEKILVEKRLDFRNLPLIYFTRGVLDIKTENDDFINNFSKAIKLCDLYENEKLKNQIKYKLNLYDIKVY